MLDIKGDRYKGKYQTGNGSTSVKQKEARGPQRGFGGH